MGRIDTCLKHNIMLTTRFAVRIKSLGFVRSKLNLAHPLTKSLNTKLVEETLKMMKLMSNIRFKSNDNPTYKNGDLTKVGLGIKSFVDYNMLYY